METAASPYTTSLLGPHARKSLTFNCQGDDDLQQDEVDFLFDQLGSSSTDAEGGEDDVSVFDVESDWEDSQSDAALPVEIEGALTAALSSKTLTPLLKEELRCKIQLKRLQHGKDELAADFSRKASSMSIEEVVKKNKKIQQNRQSAQRSRDRRKSFEKTIQSKIDDMEKENARLAEQAKCLRHACHVAKEWLEQHRACLRSTFVSGQGPTSTFPAISSLSAEAIVID